MQKTKELKQYAYFSCMGLDLPGGSDDPEPGEGREEADTSSAPEAQTSPDSGMETNRVLTVIYSAVHKFVVSKICFMLLKRHLLCSLRL